MPISDKELLFNSLAQPHWDTFARETLALIQRENKPAPQVFISYAWPPKDRIKYPSFDVEQDTQAWLLGLHERLTNLGVKVLFDIKSMTLGASIDDFMQQSVTNSDKILIIGTESYFKRSNEATNVQKEVEHIRQKVAARGVGCVIPMLYRGEFWNALPALGSSGNNIQILGTDCHDELLYHKNLSSLIESLFQLQGNTEYQALKQSYLDKLQDIETHGLSDAAVSDFALNRAQKVRDALAMQQEAVNLMLERNAKGHPDYVPRPIGTESFSVKLLSNLKTKYSQYTHVQALFGDPMALEGQYINVQMLYQIIEDRKQEAKNNNNNGDSNNKKDQNDKSKEFEDARVTSFESIFSKKEPLEIKQLFTPAKTLLNDKQKTNEARPELPPNLVLLQGRAGIGKTTFVNFVTREWAMGRLWQEYHWVFSLRLRDLRSPIFQQASGKEIWTLSDWIYHAHFAAQMDKSTFQSLWTWLIEPDLKNKKVLFILDGYDEIPNQHPCEQALTDLLNSDTPKILTSRPYGLSDLPRDKRELEIVGFIDENVDKYVDLYFKQDKTKAQNIITGLRNAPTLWGSAHIPVTLNVICGVLEKEQDINTTLAKLNTMSDLYETMEISLLERAYLNIPGKEKENAKQLKLYDKENKIKFLTRHYEKLRQYLAKLAFDVFAKQQLNITPQDVNRVLTDMGVSIAEIPAKIQELLELGLLKTILDEVTHRDTNYEFLHLTFQEYYAARHLLWGAENNSPTLVEDFARIKLDPRWQIVLRFVAGMIKDKDKFNHFMRAIAAPQGGDMLGNVQLGLMVRCTAENWELAQQTGWSKAITKMLQKRIQGLRERFKRGEINVDTPPPVWVQMIKSSPNTYQVQTEELDLFSSAVTGSEFLFSFVSDFDEKCQNLAKFIAWLTLTSWVMLNTLAKLLANKELNVFLSAIKAVNQLGAAVAIPEFLAMLAKLLVNEDARTRYAAIEAIRSLGVAAATKDILALLRDRAMLREEAYVFHAARETIGEFGVAAAASTKEFLVPIAEYLVYRNPYARAFAIVLFKKLGAAAATKDILDLLVKLIESGDLEIRHDLIRTIDALGAAAATSEIIALLPKLLADNSGHDCGIAVEAIGKIGIAAATPDVLALLVKLTSDSEDDIRQAAACGIGNLCPATATKEFLALLAKLMVDESEYVRRTAVEAIGNFAAVAATENILALLIRLTADENNLVRKYAVEAIGKLGTTEATKEFLALIARLFSDKDVEVRNAVINTVGKLPVAAEELLALLANLLTDSNEDVRKSAAYAIGRLGQVAATKDIFALLAKLFLTDSNEDVRESAAYAIGNLAAAAATNDILTLLIKLIADEDKYAYAVAAKVIGKLGPAAAKPDIFALLPKLLADSDKDVRTAALEVIGELGPAAAKPDILALLPKLLADNDWDVCHAALGVIGKLGPAAATKDILALLSKLLSDSRSDVRQTAAYAIGLLAPSAATGIILELLPKLLADSSSNVRIAAAKAIGQLGPALATNDHMIALTRALANGASQAAAILSKIVSLYLCRDAVTSLPETPHFPVLATTLITGTYLSGNTSININHDTTNGTYHLRGFADKTPFNIFLTHAQAQWFIYWTPQIVRSLNEGTFASKLAEIENVGMNISSQKSLAWFDQSSNGSSSSSSFASSMPFYRSVITPQEAYGFSYDAAVVEIEQDKSNKCSVM